MTLHRKIVSGSSPCLINGLWKGTASPVPQNRPKIGAFTPEGPPRSRQTPFLETSWQCQTACEGATGLTR